MSRIDIQSKQFFLTYSCPTDAVKRQYYLDNFSLNNLLIFIKSKGDQDGIIAAKEHHANGDPHYHIYVIYTNTIRIRTSRFFDHLDIHPNIQHRIRDAVDVYNYINKEGWEVIKEGGLEQPPRGKKRTYAEILDSATTSTDLLAQIRSSYPRDFLLNHEKLVVAANELFRPAIPPYSTPEGYNFIVPAELEHWYTTQFTNKDRPKTLVLIGPSRFGKTAWARSLGNHMYFNNMFNLDEWDPTADYLILDDMDFDFIPARKALFFGQKQFTLTDKYRKKKTVIWGKPVIYLNNSLPDFGKYPDPYLDNVQCVFINNKMF